MLIAASGWFELVGERRGHLAHRGQPRDMDELGLQFLEPRLGLLMLGEVADESGEIRLGARLHLADRQMHRKGGSVAALACHDTPDADDMRISGGAVARDVAVVAGAVGLRHQDADVLADGLLLGPAEQALGRRAEELDDAVAVDDDHCIGNGLEDRLEVSLAGAQCLLNLFLLVDVEKDAAEMAGGTGVVPDETCPGANPASQA
ncbi:hypothetical protein ACVWZ6_002985 [Bradyrhizobium sp. GM6.1]